MTFNLSNATSIRPGLFLGGKHNEEDAQALQELGVTHICQIGKELWPSHPDASLVYLRISLDDNEHEDLVKHLPKALQFINRAQAEGGVCLVHCFAGMSRSASVCIAHLAATESLSYEEAFKQVKLARPIVNPNLGFVFQVQHFVASGCKVEQWGGWNKHRFAEHLKAYRLAQDKDTPGLRSRIRMRRLALEQEERSAEAPPMPPPAATEMVGAS